MEVYRIRKEIFEGGYLKPGEQYLEEAGMEVQLFEGIEPDPSVETVMKGAKAMEEFGPDWIVAIGGGSPIDAAKAMWIKYEYPDITFEDMCKVFGIPKLRKKAHFCAISSTSGTATEVTAFSIITDYEKGIKYPIADFEITPDVAIVDPELAETMPQKLVAHTGMDAMTHAIEAYVSTANCDFSRGSDMDIYKERKLLGEKLVNPILKAVDYDVEHTVFSFIPNTAEVAFYGLLEGFDNYLNELKVKKIEALGHHPNHEELEKILSWRIRSEKVAIKDIKLRTFIAEGNSRNDLAAHVYDITYGSLIPHVDNLVIIDDSIVRGTTLKQSIIGILDRLHPKKIVIVSSSPQVRYPDYYGIDMASMDQFIAFKAAIDLLKERDMKDVIARAYNKSKDQVGLPKEQMVNYVKEIYAPFTNEEIAAKMVELLTPKGTQAKVEIVYQTLEGLHEACPNHTGDWYFSGDYPTPGGVKLVNQAFIDYIEKVYQF